MNLRILTCLVLLIAVPASVLAQTPGQSDPSLFGVTVSFALPSDFREDFKLLLNDAEKVDIRSQDFEVGFVVRGRQLGGDWGVSYIQKNYEEGSSFNDLIEDCSQGPCFKYGTEVFFRNTRFRGVSFYKFAPFVTIRNRAQIGITAGGGVAVVDGIAEQHDYSTSPVFTPPNNFTNVQTETVTNVEAKEVFFNDPMPIWKVELTGAIIVAPGLKVKVGGGLNFTNYMAMSLGAVYLFGAR
jgi:hypothetical protein